jgi:hypothetical protein
MTRIQAAQASDLNPGRAKRFFLFSRSLYWAWGQLSLLFSGQLGFILCIKQSEGDKWPPSHLVPRLIMSGAVPLLAHSFIHGMVRGGLTFTLLLILILSSHYCLHLKPLRTRFSDQNCMLLTYMSLTSFSLILQNLATQIILGEESKLRYSSLCRLLSYVYITKCVCVCVLVRVTELKNIPFWVKMPD